MKLYFFLIVILFSNIILGSNISNSPYKDEVVENIDNSKNVKVLLVMAFKRIDDFKVSLQDIIDAAHSSEYHLIITQSIPLDDLSYYNSLNQFIKTPSISKSFKSITHLQTKSNSNLQFGNAYNAFKNLVRGLEFTWKKFPNLDSVVVFEEDIVVSKDVFEFFDRSKELINTDSTNLTKLATTAYFLHTTHPQYDWRLDKPIKRKSIRNELSLSLLNPKQLDKVKFQSEIEFKVLSWMLHKSIADSIISDFYNLIEEWVKNNDENKIENKPFTPKPDILVKNCDCWNHDRYLELRFKGYYFIGSQSPRCNHVPVGGAGLSNPGEDYGFPVNEKYTKKDEFFIGEVIEGKKGLWGLAKEYLPSVECPNRINCYNQETNQRCGSIYASTCLNIWALECVPCSGRKVTTFNSQCQEKFSQCCKDNCKASSPFFINLPSLFDE